MHLLMFWFLCILVCAGTGISGTPLCWEVCDCDVEITICRSASLSELPESIDTNVISLDLSWNEFATFPEGMQKFSDLKNLNLSHNKISILTFLNLQGLNKLEVLDLTFNLFHDWKDIHSSAFLPTKNLQFLDFSNNPLRSLAKYSNNLYIESLKVLKLSNCSMKSIPANVFNRLINLEELYLGYNPVSVINETFQLQNLKVMDISGTKLNFLSEDVFTGMKNLVTLTLNKNIHLRRFPCSSKSLRYLDLSNCMLEKIPSGLFNNLVHLDLSGNYLRYIPASSFASLFSLNLLNLSTNAITAIHDEAFDKLIMAQTIDLSYNKLTTLSPYIIANSSMLSTLNISHNYIQSLDSLYSESLRLLDASFCEIQELDRFGLRYLPNLLVLLLSRNFLSYLPDRLQATNLVMLDVSSCRIRSINNETFEEMFYLRRINLAGNSLTNIDPSYFPRAVEVLVEDNPWRCECRRLKNMYQWIATYSSQDLNNLICDSPEKVEGKSWADACDQEWGTGSAKKDTLWYYSLGIFIAMIVTLFVLVVLKRVRNIQEQQARLAEESRRAEEREALRRMQEREHEIHEEEDYNAPDPRDLQIPPSYHEAILLPRVDASHPSLAGSVSIHSFGSRQSLRGTADPNKRNRIRRKRRRRKSEEERRASRITIDDSDSSEEHSRSVDNLSPSRKPRYVPPLESDF